MKLGLIRSTVSGDWALGLRVDNGRVTVGFGIVPLPRCVHWPTVFNNKLLWFSKTTEESWTHYKYGHRYHARVLWFMVSVRVWDKEAK